jgi:hypothetical protein
VKLIGNCFFARRVLSAARVSVDLQVVRSSGFQPGGPRQQTDAARHSGRRPDQQIHGGGFKDLRAIDPHGFQPRFKVGLDLFEGPGAEQVMSTEPGTNRPMIAELLILIGNCFFARRVLSAARVSAIPDGRRRQAGRNPPTASAPNSDRRCGKRQCHSLEAAFRESSISSWQAVNTRFGASPVIQNGAAHSVGWRAQRRTQGNCRPKSWFWSRQGISASMTARNGILAKKRPAPTKTSDPCPNRQTVGRPVSLARCATPLSGQTTSAAFATRCQRQARSRLPG